MPRLPRIVYVALSLATVLTAAVIVRLPNRK